jgi:predicted aconitase with swiveling domain
MHISCKPIVKGIAEGELLLSTKSINLLTITDEGIINDSSHPLNGRSIAGKILVYPNAIGSSVGAYKLYSLKINNTFPKAIICKNSDLITASGCAIANIPLVKCDYEKYNYFKDGVVVIVNGYNGLIKFLI